MATALKGYGALAMLLVLAAVGAPRLSSQIQPLRQVAVIAMPQVTGRIDHLAFDPVRQRLFVAALANGTVEVLDTAGNARVRSLGGFREPQGVALIPELRAVAIANGGDGTLHVIDADTLETRWQQHVADDADNVRYDTRAKRVFVAGVGGLFMADPSSRRMLGAIPISGHPESFQLESTGSRVFANLPDMSQVVVGDRSSSSVAARWSTGDCGANYPMALDEAGRRLFVGCRRPASIAILDTTTGKVIGGAPAVGDTDDLFYDGDTRRLYVIGGEGFVDVFAFDGNRVQRIAQARTRSGARTGLWVASRRRLYVAVPARSGQAAEVRVFDAQS